MRNNFFLNLPPLVTSVSHMAFPTVTQGLTAQLLAMLYQLDESQWWPAAEMERVQFQQLGLLYQHARTTVPFYAEQFSRWKPNASITPEFWRELPLLSREDIQSRQDDLTSRQLPKSHGTTSTIRTSGSTGRPVTVVRSQLSEFMWRIFTLREHLWHARDFSGKLASIRRLDYKAGEDDNGLAASNWGISTKKFIRTGRAAGLNIDNTLDRQFQWLQQENPEYLLTYPSNAAALAERARAKGIRLPALQEIRTISETLTPEMRQLCREGFGVPVTDCYSTNEVGYIALQCPENEHYHVQSEHLFVEILDEKGRACAPGETGRVVLTALNNFAMPLIRYDVGDLARVGEPCPCGRGLAVLDRIMGRQRNMFTRPNGELFWPSLASVRRDENAPPVQQYQVIQKTRTRLEIRLVVTRSWREDEQAEYIEFVRQNLGHPYEIALVFTDHIPRSTSGKYEDFKSELTA